MTTEEWRAYVASGRRQVVYVGMFENTHVRGRIRRVTSAEIYVTFGEGDSRRVEPVHPGHLRPA